MGDKTGIEWTDATWNPVIGCTRVSEGCRNCYAERQAIRIQGYHDAGVIQHTDSGPRWTGKMAMLAKKLEDPLSWKKPRKVFVNGAGRD